MSKGNDAQAGGLVVRLVAELGIIVLGVLIALWADGWVAERADRRTETARIQALRANVVATRARVAAARKDAEYVSKALEQVVYWEDLEALEGEKLGVLMRAYLFGPSFTREMNVYSDLENSGELALLTSADLRQALAVMDAALDAVESAQADLLTIQQLNLDPFVVEHLAMSPGAGEILGLKGLPVDTVESLPGLRIFHNLALFKLDLIHQVGLRYAEADAALQAVETLIDE